MSGFTADWLALREAADARARRPELLDRLPTRFPAIVDLGAGSGANLRWLAPRLESPQHWALLDHDAGLLAAAGREIGDWAHARGYGTQSEGAELVVSGPDLDCRIRSFELDLGAGVAALDLPRGCLVTASALFDLVSRDWLERLVGRVAASEACVLWALSYSGSVALKPALAADADIVALVNRHQLGDKGFGPALGPEAWRLAEELLARAGLNVAGMDSSWQLGADDAALIGALIDGWAEAAASLAPDEAVAIRRWQQRRLELASTGALELSVSHRDLAAWP